MENKKINQKVSRILYKIRCIDRNKWTRNISLALLFIDIISIFVAGSNFIKFIEWVGKNQDKLFNGSLPTHAEHYFTLFSNSLVMIFCTTLILLMILWSFMWNHTKQDGK